MESWSNCLLMAAHSLTTFGWCGPFDKWLPRISRSGDVFPKRDPNSAAKNSCALPAPVLMGSCLESNQQTCLRMIPQLCRGTLLDKELAVLPRRLPASLMDGSATASRCDRRSGQLKPANQRMHARRPQRFGWDQHHTRRPRDACRSPAQERWRFCAGRSARTSTLASTFSHGIHL